MARVVPDPSACTSQMLAKELKALQEVDPSLKAVREGAEH